MYPLTLNSSVYKWLTCIKLVSNPIHCSVELLHISRTFLNLLGAQKLHVYHLLMFYYFKSITQASHIFSKLMRTQAFPVNQEGHKAFPHCHNSCCIHIMDFSATCVSCSMILGNFFPILTSIVPLPFSLISMASAIVFQYRQCPFIGQAPCGSVQQKWGYPPEEKN